MLGSGRVATSEVFMQKLLKVQIAICCMMKNMRQKSTMDVFPYQAPSVEIVSKC